MPARLLAVSNNFPTARFPEKGVFVANFLSELAEHDVAVDVIAPRSWVAELKNWKKDKVGLSFAPLSVVRPAITTLPLRIGPAKRALVSFNERRFSAGVESALTRNAGYTFVYTHFLPSGRATLRALDRMGMACPTFLNLGESDPWNYDELYQKDEWVQQLTRFTGITVVSKKSYEYILGRNPSLQKRVRYVPNGVNTRSFRPIDQTECRKKLGLPELEKIAIFCGHFDHRKGPLRVLEAVRRIGIKAAFLGSNGPAVPRGPEVLFAGAVTNAALPIWYNAADIFVLPSLSEGMSNAMLEALACGLPLVVADRDFNTSFLTAACARFVDPMDPDDIGRGIEECLSSVAYTDMCNASLRLAEDYSLAKRARAMLAFMREQTS